MEDQQLVKFRLIVIIITVSFLMSPISTSSVSTTSLYIENFEINNNTWRVSNFGDPDMIVETTTFANKSGSKGLHIITSPEITTSVLFPIDVSGSIWSDRFVYHDSLSLDLQIYNVQGFGGVRVTFMRRSIDGFGLGITLSYGPVGGIGVSELINGWQHGSLFHFEVNFTQGEWFRLNRNLGSDLIEALNHPDALYSNETLDLKTLTLQEVYIHYRQIEDQIHENYIDDLIITGDSQFYKFTLPQETSSKSISESNQSLINTSIADRKSTDIVGLNKIWLLVPFMLLSILRKRGK